MTINTEPSASKRSAAHLDVTNLPPTVDLLTAARILGIGRTAAYDLVRTQRWPTPVLHVGRKIRVPTAPLLALLGVPQEHTR
jgi:hypothetical protein